jgi:hypothetical protein
MLGDSVMIGAEHKLAARRGPGISMDAKTGRQADEFESAAGGDDPRRPAS